MRNGSLELPDAPVSGEALVAPRGAGVSVEPDATGGRVVLSLAGGTDGAGEVAADPASVPGAVGDDGVDCDVVDEGADTGEEAEDEGGDEPGEMSDEEADGDPDGEPGTELAEGADAEPAGAELADCADDGADEGAAVDPGEAGGAGGGDTDSGFTAPEEGACATSALFVLEPDVSLVGRGTSARRQPTVATTQTTSAISRPAARLPDRRVTRRPELCAPGREQK